MGGRPHRDVFCSPEHLARPNPDTTAHRKHTAFPRQPAQAFRNEKAAIADGFHHEESCAPRTCLTSDPVLLPTIPPIINFHQNAFPLKDDQLALTRGEKLREFQHLARGKQHFAVRCLHDSFQHGNLSIKHGRKPRARNPGSCKPCNILAADISRGRVLSRKTDIGRLFAHNSRHRAQTRTPNAGRKIRSRRRESMPRSLAQGRKTCPRLASPAATGSPTAGIPPCPRLPP